MRHETRCRIEAGIEQSATPNVSAERLLWADEVTFARFAAKARSVRPDAILFQDGLRVMLDTSDPKSRATLPALQLMAFGWLAGCEYAHDVAKGRLSPVHGG